jgi:hypothetical protein
MANETDVKYRAVVQSHALAKSSNNGTPSVKVVFLTKFDVSNPAVPVSKIFIADLWLTPNCFEKTMHTLTKTFGWQGTNIQEINNNNVLLAGAQCVLVTADEEYEGKVRTKVKFVNDIQKKMDEDEAAELADSLAAQVAAYKAKSPKVNSNPNPEAATEAPPSDDAPPIGDSDLPF